MTANTQAGSEIRWAFAEIPQLANLSLDSVTITALPGYTNKNFRIHNDEQDWVLRLPRPATDRFIDREAEAHNQTLAHQLKLAPQVTWRNDDGITLTPTLRSSRNLNVSDFETDDCLAFVTKPLQTLHRSGLRFKGGDTLANTLTCHYELLDTARREDFAVRMAQAQRILCLLENEHEQLVPSHRDPVLGNLLLAEGRLWLIDWEYSAMASPYWDLAVICNEAQLDLAQSRRLLLAYCADGPAMKESTLFDYRGLLKLLNDCWMAALTEV